MLDIIETRYVGTLELNDKVDVTDPCYDKDVWCRATLECKPGTYYGYAEISDEDEWGKRVARLSIYKDDIRVPLEEMACINENIGVDAGLAGFFRDKPDFDDDEWINFLDDAGCSDDWDALNPRKVYAVSYGLFSVSGYGDGCYGVYANADRTAFTLVFISNYDDEEEEDLKLVIDVPEEVYKARKQGEISPWVTSPILDAVANGKPLDEAQPCDDAVSRAEVLACEQNIWNDCGVVSVEDIKALPPVAPKPLDSVLDEIRAEIEKNTEKWWCGKSVCFLKQSDVFEIIDKHRKGEKEE